MEKQCQYIEGCPMFKHFKSNFAKEVYIYIAKETTRIVRGKFFGTAAKKSLKSYCPTENTWNNSAGIIFF